MENSIKEILLVGCIFSLIGISCKEKPSEVEKNETEEKVVALSTITSNYLVLVGDAKDFTALNSFKCKNNQNPSQREGRKVGGVVLKYKIATNGLLLDGWQIIRKGNNDYGFSANKNFSLLEAGSSNIPYKEDTYLGSIVMDNCFVQEIKGKIANNSNLPYVVFSPEEAPGGKSISYNVFLSNSPTGILEEFDAEKFKPNVFQRIKIGTLSDPIPPGGGGILDSKD